ncbi:hypothetical protein WUBG_02517 [Wuchereria bancrofti]|uniref:Uncharacterized protein n=1 Tax=Wuchereria bancrofti TaxID=6293 RepID=J9EVI0_WUCBA|nr:hypothetical protein WUBG_02517 [Wuchereria bancrofti]
MVRRRFMSKGNATFVDGLDKTVLKQCAKEHPLFRRTAILSSVLNDVLDQERDFLQPCSRKMKKKERRRRAKPIDRTILVQKSSNINVCSMKILGQKLNTFGIILLQFFVETYGGDSGRRGYE